MLAFRPDDNAVRAHKVLDCRAFAQELRIGHHIEFNAGPGLRDDPRHLAPGADPVPTGTVDLVTTTVRPSMAWAISCAAS
jgi:hypothetical protein